MAFPPYYWAVRLQHKPALDVGQWTVGAGGMWTDTDIDRGLDDGFGFDYEIGYALSEKWDVNLNAFSGNHDDNAFGANWDHEIKGLTFDFNRVFDRDARISPFILIGFGIVDQTHATGELSNKDKEVAGKLGIGATADLLQFNSTKLQLKGTLAARGSVGRGIIDTVATLGLHARFRCKGRAAAAPAGTAACRAAGGTGSGTSGCGSAASSPPAAAPPPPPASAP